MFGWGKKKAQVPEKPVVEEAPKVPRLDLSQVIAKTREEEEEQREGGKSVNARTKRGGSVKACCVLQQDVRLCFCFFVP